MKTITLTLFAATLFALSASAASPKPPADCGKDSDHDGWCVPDATRLVPALLPATGTTPFHLGALDCDDNDAARNPAATEKLGDGIDQDCDGADLVAPPYARNFGCSTAAQVAVLDAEIKACNAAGASKCSVNLTAGKFVTGFQAYFLDTDCDGKREVIDQAAKDKYDEAVRKGQRCVPPVPPVRNPASSPCRGTGCRKGTGSKAPAPVPNAKLTELERLLKEVDGKYKELPAKVTDLEGRVDGAETVLADNTTAIEGIGKVIEVHGKRLDTLEKRADDTDGELTDLRTKTADATTTALEAGDKATRAEGTARVALSTGVNAGINVGVGVKGQSSLSINGETARGGVATMLLLTGHFGAELPTGVYRLMGGIGIPWEEGKSGSLESGFIWTAGAQALWKLAPGSNHSLGITVRYLDQESGADVVGATAASRGGGGGITYEVSPGPDGSWLRFPIQVSLEAGGEARGTKYGPGASLKNVETTPYGMLIFTLGAGVGPALR